MRLLWFTSQKSLLDSLHTIFELWTENVEIKKLPAFREHSVMRLSRAKCCYQIYVNNVSINGFTIASLEAYIAQPLSLFLLAWQFCISNPQMDVAYRKLITSSVQQSVISSKSLQLDIFRWANTIDPKWRALRVRKPFRFMQTVDTKCTCSKHGHFTAFETFGACTAHDVLARKILVTFCILNAVRRSAREWYSEIVFHKCQ